MIPSLTICCQQNDRQQCTAAHILANCIPHWSELLCTTKQKADSRLVPRQVLTVKVYCSHKGTMTRNSALQHISWQIVSLTGQSCGAQETRKQIAGLCHCKFNCDSLLLTQRHNDEQRCTAAQVLVNRLPHRSKLLCKQQPDSRPVSLQCRV